MKKITTIYHSKSSGLFIKLKKRSEEHTSELQSRPQLVCRPLLEKKKYERPARRPHAEPSTDQAERRADVPAKAGFRAPRGHRAYLAPPQRAAFAGRGR